MISRLFQRIIWRETFGKRHRKGYSIVSNSTVFETNVTFSPWTKKVTYLNLLLHCLLWPKIAKNKVLGLLQPLEANWTGREFCWPNGNTWWRTVNIPWWCCFSWLIPSLPYLFRGGNRTTHSGDGKREAWPKQAREMMGRRETNFVLPNTPRAPLLTAPLSLIFIGDWETTWDASAAFYCYI